MDEWRDFYYSMNPGARNVEIGDLSPRKKLRDDLKAGLSLLGTLSVSCPDFRPRRKK
jgi:hypothetical protein